MRAIVLDNTLQVVERAQKVLAPLSVRILLAGSLSDLPVLAASSSADDLLIVNLTGELTGWHLASHIRRAAFAGRTLAFVSDLSHPALSYLIQLPRVQCVVRPASTQLLDRLLQQSVVPMPPSGGPRLPEAPALTRPPHIVGGSRQILDIFSRIEKVAAADANVCVYGESGTGKELIAHAIHSASPRRNRPFVPLDCTAIPEGLMESHLFGHVKGAFTGAVDHRDGVFSLAHTGTLFIDELCELSLSLQAKLLRVIQTREFFKVGGTKPIRTDIRLITATNKDPKERVDRGAFREDLYYRVAVVMIKVPPLRERREDIPVLVEHFVTKFSRAYKKPIRGIEPRALERMVAAAWPGNVRQLENLLEQAVVLAEGEMLTERGVFGEDIHTKANGHVRFELGLPLHEVERQYILHTLQANGGNRSEVARLLGISVRCLQYKLKAYLEDGNSVPGLQTARLVAPDMRVTP